MLVYITTRQIRILMHVESAVLMTKKDRWPPKMLELKYNCGIRKNFSSYS